MQRCLLVLVPLAAACRPAGDPQKDALAVDAGLKRYQHFAGTMNNDSIAALFTKDG